MAQYFVESEFEHMGMKCVVVMQSTGYRCGYVGVDKSHSLYGKTYSAYLDIKKESLVDFQVSGVVPLFIAALDQDERIRIDAYFKVHGGITYSDGGKKSNYPIDSDLWWFGFDCCHCDDKNDYETAKKLFADDKETMERILHFEKMDKEYGTHGEVRTLDYVTEECKRLAEQLYEYGRK